MQKITPFLWFNDNAEEAMNFYTSVFKEAKAGNVVRLNNVPGQGQVLTATLELFGQKFTLLNGGPKFQFTEAVSFVVNCESQEEVDYYWERLTGGGGKESMCGWLKDKFGLSWQIIPSALPKLLGDKDAAKAGRVMNAMLQMRKIDLTTLQQAYDGEQVVA
ncbi:MAG TPA: VOC family protein [Flavisolibacter sp.]|nr:VOC family protein [Flavisolibacter sp.]